MWNAPKFNKKFKPVRPDDRRGFHLPNKEARTLGIRGAAPTESELKKAKIFGIMALTASIAFYLFGGVAMLFENFLTETMTGFAFLGAMISAITVHIVAMGGEAILGVPIRDGMLALKIFWFPIIFFTLFGIVGGLFFRIF